MTRIAFAIRMAAVALSITPAVAADLGRFPPASRFYPPTPMLRVYNWTGCYLGGQLGGAFADNKLNGQLITPVPAASAIMVTDISQNVSSTSVTVAVKSAVTSSLHEIGLLARRLMERGRTCTPLNRLRQARAWPRAASLCQRTRQ